MSCSCPRPIEGTDKFFSGSAKQYAKRFRRKGLAREQQFLVEGISQTSILDKTILEIGCGVGGLHLTLLARGGRAAVGIDIALGVLEEAKALSRQMGWGNKTMYVPGDFVRLAGD